MNFANVKEWRIPVSGTTIDVLRVTRNNVVLWEKQPSPDYSEPFYAENITNQNETLSIRKYDSSAPTLTIEYSADKTTWHTLGTTSTTAITITLQPNAKVYLRCNANTWYNGYGNDISGVSKVGGNIMSLLYGSNFTGRETVFPANSTDNFNNLFGWSGSSLLDVSELILPAITLTNYCYYMMFRNCSSLTTAPALPATTMAESCYTAMFRDCTSLITAPALPATTLADYCYNAMFTGCSSLTTAPSLPATTLAENCYNGMFQGCTALTTAPALPAITLAKNCYYSMFSNCSSLTTTPELPATALANGCYFTMFQFCSSLTTTPELPATILADYCYGSMFRGCTSLTKAPTLPATTLVDNCYNWMFYECTSLNNVKCLATNISAQNCTYEWLYRVSSNGKFTKAAGITWPRSISGIPSSWTVVEE